MIHLKASGITHEKNATRCHMALLIGMCSTDVYMQNKPAAVAPKETITHHFFVSEFGQKKTVDAAKFVAAQKMCKTETSDIRKLSCSGFFIPGILCSQSVLCIITIITWRFLHRYE